MTPIFLTLSAKDSGVRIDKVIATHIPEFSRSRIQQWIADGYVTIDGEVATMKTPIYGDETIIVTPQPAMEESSYISEELHLDIVYEDDAIIVINKPSGLVVHPGAGNWTGTLQNGLLHHDPKLAAVPRAGIVHRLDKDTTGLMVVAKTLTAQTDLVRQLQDHTVRREYLALVWGTPKAVGTINAAIARHPRDRIKMAVSTSSVAKPAITHFESIVAGRLDHHQVTLVRCKLETGRTHQIRVHMTSIGHALVGDPLYGRAHLADYFPRQALHAERLGLLHPVSGEKCFWQVPLTQDFKELLVRAQINLVQKGDE